MGPVRNQGGLGWCYAFTASDLMTHYLYKKEKISNLKAESLVSPLSVASKYNEKFLSIFSPEKELMGKKYKKEQQQFFEEQDKKYHEKMDKVKTFLSDLNPLKDNTAKPSTPLVTMNKDNPPTGLNSKLKASGESDLVGWDNLNTTRDYSKELKIPISTRNKILEHYFKTGNLAEAREMFFGELNEMNAAKFRLLGVQVVGTGGYIGEAIISSKDSYCLEKESRSGDIGLDRFDLMRMLDSLFDSTKKNGKIACSSLQNFHRMLPTTNMKDLVYVLQNADRSRAYEILIDKACKRKMSLDPKEPEIMGWTIPGSFDDKKSSPAGAQKILEERMDKILEKGTPVGINYYNDFLTSPNASGKWGHASSIVGKRINGETCKEEYILRNSYGTGCALYQKLNPDYVHCIAMANKESKDVLKNRMKSQCDKSKIPSYLNPKLRCEEGSGYLFVEKAELVKNMTGITFLKE